jgi:hypothetical protein
MSIHLDRDGNPYLPERKSTPLVNIDGIRTQGEHYKTPPEVRPPPALYANIDVA